MKTEKKTSLKGKNGSHLIIEINIFRRWVRSQPLRSQNTQYQQNNVCNKVLNVKPAVSYIHIVQEQ